MKPAPLTETELLKYAHADRPVLLKAIKEAYIRRQDFQDAARIRDLEKKELDQRLVDLARPCSVMEADSIRDPVPDTTREMTAVERRNSKALEALMRKQEREERRSKPSRKVHLGRRRRLSLLRP